MWMLDTNICIYIIKKKPLAVYERLQTVPMDQVIISSVTLAELNYGVNKSASVERNQHTLDQFLTHLSVVPWGDCAADHYGEIRTILERQGTPIGNMDLMIAAHARSLPASLVTHNSREFKRVPDLQWEDWI
ncbi:MAG: type II toxin-antitoxin system VapC family toxin [Magnetococcales bacterium]|nr:type II toxin-antitoxin system VapC family toxin [Magnetococcales bacterium]